MLLLTTNQDSLWLYGERRLKWACSLPFRAVSTITLRLADGPLQSCLVLLGDAGELSVGCLGTSPSLEMVSSLHNRFAESTEFKRKGSKSGGRVPVDDQKPSSKLEFDQEMQRLRQVIANADTEFDRMLRVDTDEAAETKSDQDQSTDFDTGEKHVGPDDLTVYMTTGQAKVIVGQVMAHSADDEEVETSIRHWLARQLNPETISMFEFGVHLQTKSSSVADVQCFVGSVDSVQVRPDTFQWKLIEPNTTTDRLTVRVHFAANQMSFLNSQCISLVITYVGSKGSVQVVTIQQIIPLIMFCSSTTSAFAQENESLFKFALLANQSDLDLRNFFGDLTPSVNLFGVSADSTSWHRKQDDRSTNRIVIKCISGTVVESKPNKSTDEVDTETLFSNVIKEDLVLVQFGNIDRSGSSKYSHGDTLHRYEITLSGSELMATIYVLNHLLHTIQRLRLQQSKAIVKVEFGSNFLAMQEYFERIDRHLEARQRLQQNKSQLEDYCVQYRCINKRLLIKLKERNLTSLSNLDILLEMYYEKVMIVANF